MDYMVRDISLKPIYHPESYARLTPREKWKKDFPHRLLDAPFASQPVA